MNFFASWIRDICDDLYGYSMLAHHSHGSPGVDERDNRYRRRNMGSRKCSVMDSVILRGSIDVGSLTAVHFYRRSLQKYYAVSIIPYLAFRGCNRLEE